MPTLTERVEALASNISAAILKQSLPTVDMPAAGAMTAWKISRVTAAGTYTAPSVSVAVSATPLLTQRFGIHNNSTRIVYAMVPNTAGVNVKITILPGSTTIWRQKDAGYYSESGKPQARLDERYRNDLEMWDRARDHTPGTLAGEFATTGQEWVPQGYTTASAADPAAYPKYIGTGSAARISTDTNGAPLGVFAQAKLADTVLYMRARWTINPNTTNGGSTAGTANTGSVGLIAWQEGFNGNGTSPNVLSPFHLSVSPTSWTLAVIYDPGNGTPTFANIRGPVSFATPLAQDGTTVHSCEVVIDPFTPNTQGGRGIAYVYGPDGVVTAVHNNAFGVIAAPVATFEIYKSGASQKLAEFVEIAADSRRTDRILKASRDAATPQPMLRQRYLAGSGTITKPAGAKFAHVQMWGAGGSGGTGARLAATAAGSGGGGGGAGSWSDFWLDAADLAASFSYQVGAGGQPTAPPAAGTTATGGVAGQAGGNTWMVSATGGMFANGGTAGGAGNNNANSTAGAGGLPSAGLPGLAGGTCTSGAAGGSAPAATVYNHRAAGGGAAGGGVAATTQAQLTGGTGGGAVNQGFGTNGGAAGAAGANGSDAVTPTNGGPSQGGGGGGSTSTNSNPKGGNGGFPGSGGGGGGAGFANGTAVPGPGGAGANGLLVIDWYF